MVNLTNLPEFSTVINLTGFLARGRQDHLDRLFPPGHFAEIVPIANKGVPSSAAEDLYSFL
jgi:hypothetical protein